MGLALFTMQGDIEAFGDESLTHVFDALTRAVVRIGDVLVCPVRTGHIGLEKNVGSTNFLRRALEFFDDIKTMVAFDVAQADNINLLHGITT